MTHRKRFLFDADEVLFDFQSACFDILRKFNGRVLTADDYLVWDFFVELTTEEKAHVRAEVSKPGFCRNLKPLGWAQDAVTTIRELVDVYAVTSPWDSPTWVYERNEALKEHFGIDKKHIVQTSAKYLVRGDFFLDDNPDHVTHWASEHPHGVAMLWHIPNTRKLGHEEFRVRSWAEVLDRVRKAL
jgi:5'(3')-deoxyribonucleotidase